MTLKEDMLTDLTDVFYATDEFAESITYTPYGGAATSIDIIREDQDPSIISEPPPDDEMIIRAQTSDVSIPQNGDIFVIAGETWKLKKNLGIIADEVRLCLTRSEWRQM